MSTPNPVILEVANALIAQLNSETFSMSFTAERKFHVAEDLEQLTSLQVIVVPRGIDYSRATRADLQGHFQIDVGFRKLLTEFDENSDEIRTLLLLVQEVVVFVMGLPAVGNAPVLSVENDPVYSPDMLEETTVFLSVLKFTLKALVP